MQPSELDVKSPRVTPSSLDRLSWAQVQERLAHDDRLLIPSGALAQHGPHLPLGANTLIADRVATAVSVRLNILKAPPLQYGVVAPTKGQYPGQSGLRRKTLHRTVNELLAGWEDRGVRRFYLITSYRYDAHLDALLMALTTGAETAVVNLYGVSLDGVIETSPVREHGGELETSLLLFLEPDSVTMANLPEPSAVRRRYPGRGIPTPPAGSRGVVGHPEAASKSKGARAFQRYVDAVCRAVEGTRRTAPDTGPRTPTPGMSRASDPGSP